MPYYQQQQQQPGMFPAIDQTFDQIHPLVKWVLAFCLAVGGFFIGISQPWVPVALCMAFGFLLGLLLVAVLQKLAVFVVAAGFVLGAALACFWLLDHEDELRHHHTAPVEQSAPVSPAKPAPQSLLHDLRLAVQQ